MGVLTASPEAGDASGNIIPPIEKSTATFGNSSKSFMSTISEGNMTNPNALISASNCNSTNIMNKDKYRHMILMENDVDEMSTSTIYDRCQFPYYRSNRNGDRYSDAVLVKDVGVSCLLLNQNISEIPVPKTKTLVTAKHVIASQYIDSKDNLCLKLRLFSNAGTQCATQQMVKNSDNILFKDISKKLYDYRDHPKRCNPIIFTNWKEISKSKQAKNKTSVTSNALQKMEIAKNKILQEKFLKHNTINNTPDTKFHTTLNPLLNVKAINYYEIVLDILNNISVHIVEASTEQIKLKVPLEGGSMKFTLNLSIGKSKDFWEIVTKPLCISSMEIIRQHEFLIDLIKKKDEEIAEYKAEGAELIRKNIETKTFTEEQLKINIPSPNVLDYTNAFQRMIDFYNKLNLDKCNTTFTELTSNSNNCDEMGKTEQNITIPIEDNDKNACKDVVNKDISMQGKTKALHSKNKDQSKSASNKEVPNQKTRTANMVYRPIKKLKKGLHNSIL
ncbi:hypothetical protein WH47_02461 [Habropoda laboriosa]|uniref:Non-homologous end-joining factor 1 n=1 Tax=Habropoda laboriosa TaxID=597456 RepID=A0A0L7QWM4_9HYME|nr:hypothetical protein WH47_02461 [Habropoda laboriosa]